MPTVALKDLLPEATAIFEIAYSIGDLRLEAAAIVFAIRLVLMLSGFAVGWGGFEFGILSNHFGLLAREFPGARTI